MLSRILPVLMTGLLTLSPTALSQNSRFFWTSSGELSTAWGDGSHVSYLFTSMSGPMGIAVDSTSNPPMIYYSERGAQRIMRARYDGADTVAIVTGVPGVMDLELDLVNRKIYWARNSWNDDRIQRADMDGLNSSVEDLYMSTSTAYDFNGIAIDIPNQKVYWTQSNNGGYDKLCRMNWNKTGYEILLDTYSGVLGNPWDVDILGDRMYWTDPGVGSNAIWSARKDGTDIDTVIFGVRALFFVIDPGTGTIYWTITGGIARAHLDGTDSSLFIGDLAYGMNAITYCPGNIPVNVDTRSPLPEKFVLEQNYPNPFNPETVVRYQLPVVSTVTLTIYDLLGREVAKLLDGVKLPGTYEVEFDGSGLSSGIYVCRMQAGEFTQSRRLVLLK